MPTLPNVAEWRLVSPPRAERVLVSFALTRTRIHEVSLARGAHALGLAPRALPGGARSRFYEAAVPPPHDLGWPLLRVIFQGDAPLIAHIAWSAAFGPEHEGRPYFAYPSAAAVTLEALCDDDRAELDALVVERFADTATIGRLLMPNEVDMFVKDNEPDPAALFRNRERAIDWQNRAQSFFLRLDLETKHELVPPRWGECIAVVGYRLAHRIEVRARQGKCDTVPQFPRLVEGSPQRATVASVSLYLCNLISSELENYGGMELVAWAFEMFATDRLVVHHVDSNTQRYLQGHGATNGLVFLQLPEFALCCIENQIDAFAWTRYFEPLVRAAHAFVETAGDAAVMGSAGARDPECYAFREGRHHLRSRLDELRAESQRAASTLGPQDHFLYLEDRFTSIVAYAHAEYAGPTLNAGRALDPKNRATILPRGLPKGVI